jgi:uncharacterized membrane-anchored protein YjiN (DUF445 family)
MSRQLFQKKAQSYAGNMSALIRDAVSRYDDRKIKREIRDDVGSSHFLHDISAAALLARW